MKIVELGSLVTDKATGLQGMITCLQFALGGNVWYSFQPSGLNKESGQPLACIWTTPERLGVEPTEYVDLPLNVLGTHARDTASGFEGVVTHLTLYLSGCIHLELQPGGRLEKTGGLIEASSFDIRRLEGSAIPKMSKEQVKQDKKNKPSPGELPSRRAMRV